jgi:predicted  nucleic acid-binding Zn-ribbon protein
MNKSVLKNLSKFESNVELSEVKVDLASTFNQVVDKYKYLEKTIGDIQKQYLSIKKMIQDYKPQMDENMKDLNRMQSSLKELGFTNEANELSKYMTSNLFKDYDKLHNSIK